jgi:hypothetical protein
MMTLCNTKRKIFPLFILFVGFQDLGGVSREIALGTGIGIGDTDINDSICSLSGIIYSLSYKAATRIVAEN